jgi:hypothetical protein
MPHLSRQAPRPRRGRWRLLVRLIEERELDVSDLAYITDTMAAAQRMAAADIGENAADMLRSALMRKIGD